MAKTERSQYAYQSLATKDEQSQIKHRLFSQESSMFLPRKFNVCNEHLTILISSANCLMLVKGDCLIRLKTVT